MSWGLLLKEFVKFLWVDSMMFYILFYVPENYTCIKRLWNWRVEGFPVSADISSTIVFSRTLNTSYAEFVKSLRVVHESRFNLLLMFQKWAFPVSGHDMNTKEVLLLWSIFSFNRLHISPMSRGLSFKEFVKFLRLDSLMCDFISYDSEGYICIKWPWNRQVGRFSIFFIYFCSTIFFSMTLNSSYVQIMKLLRWVHELQLNLFLMFQRWGFSLGSYKMNTRKLFRTLIYHFFQPSSHFSYELRTFIQGIFEIFASGFVDVWLHFLWFRKLHFY